MSRELKPIYFNGLIGKEILKVTQFPTGEFNIEMDVNKLLAYNSILRLVVVFPYNPGIEMAMFRVIDILEQYQLKFDIIFPYLPYQRADRNIQINDYIRFESHLWFLEKLNNYKMLNEVVLYSIHNPDCLRRNSSNINFRYNIVNPEYDYHFMKDDYDHIILPDEGAERRFARFSSSEKAIKFSKRRNEDGSIKYPTLINKEKIKGKKLIILDDIIDGGATIEGLVKEYFSEAEYVDVYAIHGIFTGKSEPKLNGVRNVMVEFNYMKDYFDVKV